MEEYNPTYPSVVLSKSLRPVPRTVSEANRDARYACAIQTFKSDAKLTLDFLGNAAYGFCVVAIALTLPVLLVVWLTK
jgi:hypothetical protein